MALYHILLGLLSQQPLTGYQIKQMFESSIVNFWNAHISQIYRELSHMEEKCWVTSQVVPQAGKPDKKVYSIAPAGLEVFMQWLREFSESEETIRSEFLVRVFFASHINLADLAYELKRYMRKKKTQLSLDRQGENELRELYKKGDKEAFFQLMPLRMGIKSREAAIEWAEESLQMIEEIEKNASK